MPDASVSLGLDANQFERELAAAGSKLQGFGKTMSGALGGLGAGLSIGGITAALGSLIQYGAHIADLSKTYGVSTDSLQKFGNAAEKNGSSLEGVASGFKKLEGARSKALGGNQEMVAAFIELGVGMQDLAKMNPEQIFLKIGGSSLNAAEMLKVFGKNALELRPLMRGLADGSIEMGDAIDKGMIAKLKKADDTFKNAYDHMRVYGATALDAIYEGGLKIERSTNKLHDSIIAGSKNAWSKAGSYFENLFHGRIKEAAKDMKDIFSPPKTVDMGGGIRAANKDEASATTKTSKPFDTHEDLMNTTLDAIKEKAKLTLGELANRDAFGEGAVYKNKYIGKDIMQAQQAEREKGLAEDAAFAGRDVEAKEHMGRYESLTSGIGSLKGGEKGLEGILGESNKKLDTIATNTGKPFVNH